MLRRLVPAVFSFGFLALPCFAQAPDAASTPSPAPATASAGSVPAQPKKVWTNDDLPGVRTRNAVFSDKSNQRSGSPATQPVDSATVTRIKKNLEKLQTQLDEVNKKLQTYKEFQAGEPVSTGERDLSKGYSRTPVDQQIAQLEQKKKQLESDIGDLLDDARKKGIDPGQLR